MASTTVDVDPNSWEQQAKHWEDRAGDIRRETDLTPDAVDAVIHRYAPLQLAELARAHLDALVARRAKGARMALDAEDTAARIRRSLQSYSDTETDNQRRLDS